MYRISSGQCDFAYLTARWTLDSHIELLSCMYILSLEHKATDLNFLSYFLQVYLHSCLCKMVSCDGRSICKIILAIKIKYQTNCTTFPLKNLPPDAVM